MDLQYVEDVSETFIRCLLSPVEGAHVFNLAGDVVDMHDFISTVERVDASARGLLTAEGPEVPVAFRMSDKALRSIVGEMPKTPLDEGIRRTLDGFRSLTPA
jgi:nucleoside-diphosphate-sugar epimerase